MALVCCKIGNPRLYRKICSYQQSSSNFLSVDVCYEFTMQSKEELVTFSTSKCKGANQDCEGTNQDCKGT